MASSRTIWVYVLVLACCLKLVAQTPPPSTTPPAPDVLVFANGERLIGKLVRANGSLVTFKSDSVGEVNVDWSKIQELRSSLPFAVVGKDVKLGRRSDLSQVPRGTIEVANKTVTLTEPGRPPATMPVDQAAHIIDQ